MTSIESLFQKENMISTPQNLSSLCGLDFLKGSPYSKSTKEPPTAPGLSSSQLISKEEIIEFCEYRRPLMLQKFKAVYLDIDGLMENISPLQELVPFLSNQSQISLEAGIIPDDPALPRKLNFDTLFDQVSKPSSKSSLSGMVEGYCDSRNNFEIEVKRRPLNQHSNSGIKYFQQENDIQISKKSIQKQKQNQHFNISKRNQINQIRQKVKTESFISSSHSSSSSSSGMIEHDAFTQVYQQKKNKNEELILVLEESFGSLDNSYKRKNHGLNTNQLVEHTIDRNEIKTSQFENHNNLSMSKNNEEEIRFLNFDFKMKYLNGQQKIDSSPMDRDSVYITNKHFDSLNLKKRRRNSHQPSPSFYSVALENASALAQEKENLLVAESSVLDSSKDMNTRSQKKRCSFSILTLNGYNSNQIGLYSEKICYVCSKELANGEPLYAFTLCEHAAHEECLQEAIGSHNEHHFCPGCIKY